MFGTDPHFLKKNLKWAAMGLLSLLLAACGGFYDHGERTERVDQGRLQREAVLPDRSIYAGRCPVVEMGLVQARRLPSLHERGRCGHEAPFALSGLGGRASVAFSQEARMNCVMITQLYRFFAEDVQPQAMSRFGVPVAEIQVPASYACRNRNNKRGGKLSEHGKMNAIDISGLTLANGQKMTVLDDWRRRNGFGDFLRSINRSACKYFTTVIGPGGDKYHQDHFHLDHAHHGKDGLWRLCQ